jgi:capsular polysaccharide biosynthesis protein
MLASPKITNSPPTAIDETDQLIRGVFESPNSFAWGAIVRNRLLVCVLAVVVALIGVGYGLSRQRAYTASATLQVGQVNPNSPGFYSYIQSASALATAFSRSISAEPVLATVQRKLKLAPATAVGRLSSEPIPQSPAFRVVAVGPTGSAAIQLANVAATAVIAYESASNSSNPEAASLLHEYQGASFQLQQAVAGLTSLGLRKGVSTDERAHAEAEKTAAEVRLRAIGNAYVSAVTSQAPRSGLVSLLAGATSASSNRKSKVETFGFIGLLAGIVIGCVAAILRERRRVVHLPEGGGQIQRSKPV